MSLSEWSGINALLYYGPTLVESIGFKGDTVTLAVSGGIGIVQFLAVLPAIIIIDRVGAFLLSCFRFLEHPAEASRQVVAHSFDVSPATRLA